MLSRSLKLSSSDGRFELIFQSGPMTEERMKAELFPAINEAARDIKTWLKFGDQPRYWRPKFINSLPNKALRLTFDPTPPWAATKRAPASIAAELGR